MSDQGGLFLAAVTQQVLKLCQTQHLNTTAYHPACRALTERFDSALAVMPGMYTSKDKKDRDDHSPLVTSTYNTLKQAQTSHYPFFISCMVVSFVVCASYRVGFVLQAGLSFSGPHRVVNRKSRLNYEIKLIEQKKGLWSTSSGLNRSPNRCASPSLMVQTRVGPSPSQMSIRIETGNRRSQLDSASKHRYELSGFMQFRKIPSEICVKESLQNRIQDCYFSSFWKLVVLFLLSLEFRSLSFLRRGCCVPEVKTQPGCSLVSSKFFCVSLNKPVFLLPQGSV